MKKITLLLLLIVGISAASFAASKKNNTKSVKIKRELIVKKNPERKPSYVYFFPTTCGESMMVINDGGPLSEVGYLYMWGAFQSLCYDY